MDIRPHIQRLILPGLAIALAIGGCAEPGTESNADRPTILLVDAAGDVSRMMRLDPGASQAEVVRPELGASARGLTLDRTEGILYWATREGDRIQFGRWNDASVSDLPVAGLDSAYSVEYLAEDNTLYWSDYGTHAIHRLNLGGGEVETFVDGLDAPRQIAIDPENRRIYWVDRGRGEVVERGLDEGAPRQLATGLSAPYGIALLPGEDAAIVGDAELGVLYRLDLVTSELSVWLDEAGTHPSFLAVDTTGRMLYWGDNRDNVVRRRSLDGGPMETIADGFAGPRGLVLIR
jgi:sugar lactone lactonase YvrE